MGILNEALAIDNSDQRHPSQFEQVDLLAIQQRDSMLGIRQSHKWKMFGAPIEAESCWPIWTHGNDLCIPLHKLLIVVSQARQLRAAKRSEKSAQKGQYDWPAAVIRKANNPTGSVIQLKIRRGLPARFRDGHLVRGLLP